MKKIVILLSLISTSLVGQTTYQKDFSEFWTILNENYAYFEQQEIDWDKVREIYQPQADKIKNRDEFIKLLEQVINELYNGHTSLNTNLNSSNKIIPSGSDIFVQKEDNRYIISDIRKNFPSDRCGLRPGMRIVKFNGKNIDELLPAFLPKYAEKYNQEMYAYALNMIFAGTHDKERKITVLENGVEKEYFPDRCETPHQTENLLEYKILEGNIGYIKINNSLGNNSLIPAFDLAVDSLQKTKKLIVDLTETPGGGNSAVARAIMGRFVDKELPYQKHQLYETEYKINRSWTEYVSPRKTTYTNEVVVMVGHWTGSMGEGMAIGFDAMERTKVVGTKMAGLLGAIDQYSLSQTKIGFQFPTERLYHVNGTPREEYLPKYLCDNSIGTWEKVTELCHTDK